MSEEQKLLDELDGLIDTIGITYDLGNKRGHEIIKILKETYLEDAERFNTIQTNSKPQTVEISLEDAKVISDSLGVPHAHLCSNIDMFRLMRVLKDAISKAESKNSTSKSAIEWAKEGLGENLMRPINIPANSIQDQVNELRKDNEMLKGDIVILQGNINNTNDHISKCLDRESRILDKIAELREDFNVQKKLLWESLRVAHEKLEIYHRDILDHEHAIKKLEQAGK